MASEVVRPPMEFVIEDEPGPLEESVAKELLEWGNQWKWRCLELERRAADFLGAIPRGRSIADVWPTAQEEALRAILPKGGTRE